MLMNFNPLIKLLLFVPQGEDLSFFSFVSGTNLFSVSKFTCSPKKESEKLKNSHFGQIHVQFVLFTVSYWVSAMNEHSLWIHISQLSHRTALWPFTTAPLQRPQSALQFVQYQAPSPDSILKSSLSPRFEHKAWKRFSHSSHSRSRSNALQYFLHKPHWNLGPGFISISPARMIRINKFVPFESLRTSAISKFPNTCQALRYSAVGMFVTNPTFLVWTKRIHSIHPFPKNESKNQKQNRFVEQLTSDLGATMPKRRHLCLNETWSHDSQWANQK